MAVKTHAPNSSPWTSIQEEKAFLAELATTTSNEVPSVNVVLDDDAEEVNVNASFVNQMWYR